MDLELQYREHIANVAANGLKAALAFRRLKMLSPPMAQQLFGATVALIMNYASNVWMHTGKGSTKAMERVQRTGVQAIIRSFRTVALAIAEAEAHIRPIYQRHQERATKLWIEIQTLLEKHPFRKLIGRVFRRYTSPL
jgi:predicted ATP-dependent endonuclease of OLD family